jgi:HSP20 family molecular chaperone IbpA
MKHQLTTETTESPAIFRLLPEDHFLQVMEDMHRLIARRAYELYRGGGFTHGHDLDDWLQAESEILESVSLELSEAEDSITVVAKLPGCRTKDIEIHVNPRHFFISGQREEKTNDKRGKTSHSEPRPRCVFCVVDLPAPIDPERVSATLTNGELRIELPKRKTANEIPLAAKAAA